MRRCALTACASDWAARTSVPFAPGRFASASLDAPIALGLRPIRQSPQSPTRSLDSARGQLRNAGWRRGNRLLKVQGATKPLGLGQGI
jgi:hypothetical protein